MPTLSSELNRHETPIDAFVSTEVKQLLQDPTPELAMQLAQMLDGVSDMGVRLETQSLPQLPSTPLAHEIVSLLPTAFELEGAGQITPAPDRTPHPLVTRTPVAAFLASGSEEAPSRAHVSLALPPTPVSLSKSGKRPSESEPSSAKPQEKRARITAASETKALVDRFQGALQRLFEAEESHGHQDTAEADGAAQMEMEREDAMAVDEETAGSAASGGFLSLQQLVNLRGEVARIRKADRLAEVQQADILRLMAILGKHTELALELDLNEEDDDVEQLADTVIQSLTAAAITMDILTTPGMPRQIYLDEVIENVISLCRYQMTNNIFPAYDDSMGLGSSRFERASTKKGKKASADSGPAKFVLGVYRLLCELLHQLGVLLQLQPIVDTSVHELASIGLAPFFVENIGTLQLSALHLVRTIFARYPEHRSLLIDDILSSLIRIPASARNRRGFRLNDNTSSIQMVTALVLQLLHSAVNPEHLIKFSQQHLLLEQQQQTATRFDTATTPTHHQPAKRVADDTPVSMETEETVLPASTLPLRRSSTTKAVVSGDPSAANPGSPSNERELSPETRLFNQTVAVMWKDYEAACLAAQEFVTTFLKRCTNKKDENDYKPVLESFAKDLLTVLHLPEWPAAEVVLHTLCAALIPIVNGAISSTDATKASDSALRLLAIEIVGMVATRIKQDHLELQGWAELDGNLNEVYNMDKIQQFEQQLSAHLRRVAAEDASFEGARLFVVSQTAAFVSSECKIGTAENAIDIPEAEASQLVKVFLDTTAGRMNDREEVPQPQSDIHLVCKALAMRRPLCLSWDALFRLILGTLNDQNAKVRANALKELSGIMNADPEVLGESMVQKAVHSRLLDVSIAVREAALELLGKFVTTKPEFADKYFPMILERIRDVGVFVRKRVIRILKDICANQPHSSRVVTICVAIMGRITDENDGIRAHVLQTFQEMWFGPLVETGSEGAASSSGRRQKTDSKELYRRVLLLRDVVGELHKSQQTELFDQLLAALLQPKDQSSAEPTPFHDVISQLVASLVNQCLVLNDESAQLRPDESTKAIEITNRILASVCTLHAFAKCSPHLLVSKAMTLQPYLGIVPTCSPPKPAEEQAVQMIVCQVAQLLQLVVPLMDDPSTEFLTDLEEILMKNIMKQSQTVVQYSIKCLSTVVIKVTRNYAMVENLRSGFANFLDIYRESALKSPNPRQNPPEKSRMQLMRSIFTLGLLFQYFDFDAMEAGGETPPATLRRQSTSGGRGAAAATSDKPKPSQATADLLAFFMTIQNEDVQLKALLGIGFLVVRFPSLLLQPKLKQLYRTCLDGDSVKMRGQVLRNFQTFLQEEEARLSAATQEAQAAKQKTNANKDKVEKDVDIYGKHVATAEAGLASNLMQHYLNDVLAATSSPHLPLRQTGLQVLGLILRQGLVSPLICVANLIALLADGNAMLRERAFVHLGVLEERIPTCLVQRTTEGVQKALDNVLAQLVSSSALHEQQLSPPLALACSESGFGRLFTLVKTVRHRSEFLRALLRVFEKSTSKFELLRFVAEILAALPYGTIDEPLLVIDKIGRDSSVRGASIGVAAKPVLHFFRRERQALVGDAAMRYDSDSDTEDDAIISKLSHNEACAKLRSLVHEAHSLIIMVSLRKYLKAQFGLTDAKCKSFAFGEKNKSANKQAVRRDATPFAALTWIEPATIAKPDGGDVEELLRQWQLFSQLMSEETVDEFGDEEGASEMTGTPMETTVRRGPKKKAAAAASPRAASKRGRGRGASRGRGRARTYADDEDDEELQEALDNLHDMDDDSNDAMSL
ncbi:hypothetical protein CAOG_001761 [Capsaspora owczarzaki ATCC 30864]|uniref:Sister chromatid cohesion protein n=2 Tax=Capsaspora owczarzaki (strain ATCC 30864) TaxID=595528 RepID=A0A0D2X1A1_CAPO3|nr:hypothetical protein CAOG_001761 [Capsaspora owczarzaki ATCC 30864]